MPDDEHAQRVAAAEAAIDAVAAAFRAAEAAINAVDPRPGYELATQLRDRMGELRADGETLRGEQVRRIRRDEELDLADLGASLGTPLTAQRVSQMIKRAKAANPAPTRRG